MGRKVRFALLERVVDGKVTWRNPKIWRLSEARHYVAVAATQGETYHIVECTADVGAVDDKPTKSLSFFRPSSSA